MSFYFRLILSLFYFFKSNDLLNELFKKKKFSSYLLFCRLIDINVIKKTCLIKISGMIIFQFNSKKKLF